MQKLRTSNLLLLVISLVLGVVYLQSCKKTDNCEGIQCQNGGICSNGACYCPSGFGGDNCEINLSCQGVNCQNGGTCVNGTCSCPTGFGGDNCEINLSCQFIECQNGGSCTDGVCDCPAGFGGDNCETFLTCEVLSPLCPTNSSCAIENGEAYCYCNNFYEGAICETLTRSFYTNGNTFYTPIEVCTQGGPPGIPIGQAFTYDAVKFSNGATVDEFIMENFHAFDTPSVNVKAKISSLNTFTVPNQTQSGWGLTVKGQDNTNGTLNRATNKVILPYQITYDDTSVDICTVEFTRQ